MAYYKQTHSEDDLVNIEETHAGDGSEEIYTVDCFDKEEGIIFITSTGDTAVYAVEEAVHRNGTWDEILSGETVDGVAEKIVLTGLKGGALRIKVTASVSTVTEGIVRK